MKRAFLGLLVLAACTAQAPAPRTDPSASAAADPATPSVSPSPTGSTAAFSMAPVMRTIRRLAGFGPREATSVAYRRAAGIVENGFRELGYLLRRQPFSVPRGVSWGVPVPAGSTFNVIAEPPGFDQEDPHLIVGAHLDTVPQSPGANDNASGVAIALELARLVREGAPLPIVFVAFGAEEPRASGDEGHHYGSRYYASRLTAADRAALLGVIAIDRVGAGSLPLVCTGGLSPLALRDALLESARRLDVRARACDNRTSDHWPFERRGETVARLDGGRFPGYHSSGDVVSRISREQVRSVGVICWETLRRLTRDDLV